MSRQLTAASTLDNLKKEAKRWLRALRVNDVQASARRVRRGLFAARSSTSVSASQQAPGALELAGSD
ncbi:MAG: hypothetical protein ACRD2A_15290, partial [Vicinamibacterales bacterium]